MRRVAAAAGLTLLLARVGVPALLAAPAQPFLFLTTNDVERARRAARENPPFARLAGELVQRATNGLETDLPAFDRAWWDTARLKPWRDTYPDIFHHTFTVPMKWADLARTCARASLLPSAPAEELAEKSKRLLLRLAAYTFEFEHYDVGMNYTLWAAAALEAYDILHARFTPAERGQMDAGFERYLAAVTKNDEYWVAHEPGGRLNNHYAWHKLGLAMMGLFYGRPALVEAALHGPKGVTFMLAHGFKDDGLWLEGSIPYQFAATDALLLLAQLLENAGHPFSLFRHTTPDGRSLKQSYDALLPLLFPDRTLPTIGDCYGRRPHLAEHASWETLYRQFREPAGAWLLRDRNARLPQALFNGVPDLPPAAAPSQLSALWPEMGYVALRSLEGADYWSGRGWSVFGTWSRQPVHENADKLSIILFADGHLWLPDCEARPSAEHAFSSAVQSRLNRETLCHNTLLVDGQSQRLPARRLDLVEYQRLPSAKRVTFGDLSGQLYPGVRQLRTVIVRDDYVLDFFQVMADAPRAFAWLLHVDGTPAAGSLQESQPVTLPPGAPWSYLQAPRVSQAPDRVWECFARAGRRLQVDVLADGPLEVVTCGFPRDDSAHPAVLPMRMLRRHGTNAWFLAAYRIVSEPGQRTALETYPGAPGTLELVFTPGGATHRHVVPSLRHVVK